jgi:hypothetical protein
MLVPLLKLPGLAVGLPENSAVSPPVTDAIVAIVVLYVTVTE